MTVDDSPPIRNEIQGRLDDDERQTHAPPWRPEPCEVRLVYGPGPTDWGWFPAWARSWTRSAVYVSVYVGRLDLQRVLWLSADDVRKRGIAEEIETGIASDSPDS